MRDASSTTTHREQLRVFCEQAGVAVVGTLASGGLIALALWHQVAQAPLLWWCASLVASTSAWFAVALAARRARAATPEPLRWLWALTVMSIVTGATWGGCAILYLRPEQPLVFGACILMIAGICSSANSTFSAFIPASVAFFAACLLPTAATALARGDVFGTAIAAIIVVFAGANVSFARVANRSLVESIRLRIAKEALVADLVVEKERALAAQQRAELAVIAKARFLAAASHDLRQPAHALGLFVGALRQRVSAEPEIVRLIDRIDASTWALDELLDGILDISRLDADAYHPEIAALPLAPIMRRVVDEHAEVAAEKGVELRLAPTAAWVRSDGRLLERMLRNLVGNAVRYTERGKILVGACAGAPVRLCVWDQGCGIAAEHREVIFEEFRQLHNPERDRARGLGLGLAIVRRIGNLLGHGVTVHSTVGRGSRFAIELPACEPEPTVVPPSDAAPGELTGLTVLVIDDERLAREALAAVVTSWGARALLAGSGGEALAVAGTTHIDAIVADYRLRGGETGYEAVSAVRAALAAAVPALIVTGDTAEERIREAQATGLPLAHKPVPPAELRALLSKLTSRAG